MHLYLGNKQIGLPQLGYPWFFDTAAALRHRGYIVYNPAAHDIIDRRAALSADVAWITGFSEGMVAGPEWHDSPGCRAEVALHQGLLLPVWDSCDFLVSGQAARHLPLLVPGQVSCLAR